MPFLSAILFITSETENLEFLQKELENPCFKSYHLFFLCDLSNEIIRKICEFDIKGLIKNIQRIFCGYYAVNDVLFHSN